MASTVKKHLSSLPIKAVLNCILLTLLLLQLHGCEAKYCEDSLFKQHVLRIESFLNKKGIKQQNFSKDSKERYNTLVNDFAENEEMTSSIICSLEKAGMASGEIRSSLGISLINTIFNFNARYAGGVKKADSKDLQTFLIKELRTENCLQQRNVRAKSEYNKLKKKQVLTIRLPAKEINGYIGSINPMCPYEGEDLGKLELTAIVLNKLQTKENKLFLQLKIQSLNPLPASILGQTIETGDTLLFDLANEHEISH